jgi:hypothetical protein
LLLIRHCYVERRMVLLNLYPYLDRASPEELEAAVVGYGNAISDLAAANIFPGDMLWQNFGVASYGRVVFYDYERDRLPVPPPLPRDRGGAQVAEWSTSSSWFGWRVRKLEQPQPPRSFAPPGRARRRTAPPRCLSR